MPHELLEGSPRVHLVGVGGIGVSALAELLHSRGVRVTGTDRADSERLRQLRDRGVDVRVGDDPGLIEASDLLVYTSAAKDDHPERRAAQAKGIPQFPRGAALAALVGEGYGVGVAGAHGKTTTTAILGRLLEACGEDPSAAVGGIVEGWGSPVRAGKGKHFVAEADESDRSFLALPLAVALALNVDADHLENYADYDELVECYRRFLTGAREFAVLFVDDPVLAKLAAEWPTGGPRLVTVGTGEGARYRLDEVAAEGSGMRFSMVRDDGERLGPFRVHRPGEHVVWNSACALAVALEEGVDPARAREGLEAFQGVDRRFTLRGDAYGVRVHDDYAHMPAEVAATLTGTRKAYPDRRLVAVFQPHLYSRTQAHARAFGEALAQADVAHVLPIYGAREAPVEGVTSALVCEGAPEHVRVLDAGDLDEDARALAEKVEPGDVVLTMGAGSVTRLGPKLLAVRRRGLLEQRLPGTAAHVGFDEALARYNSYQSGGPADVVVRAEDEAELQAAWHELSASGIPVKVLGGGTNVLIGDKGFRGAVVLLGKGFQGFEVEEESAEEITFRAGAALTTGKLFRRLQKAGVGGFEWFHHVPGTLGGAIVNNSGAYGQDLQGHLLEYRVLGAAGELEWHPAADLAARYRWTRLKGGEGVVVVEARLRGPRSEPEAILAEAKRQAGLRNATQPGGKGSVGCAFKNPEGGSAGKLIDQCGLKGRKQGGAQVSEKHGNFLLNADGASAADIVKLAEEVRAAVREETGIWLEYEIERIGEF